jgi:hypothetical protein
MHAIGLGRINYRENAPPPAPSGAVCFHGAIVQPRGFIPLPT